MIEDSGISGGQSGRLIHHLIDFFWLSAPCPLLRFQASPITELSLFLINDVCHQEPHLCLIDILKVIATHQRHQVTTATHKRCIKQMNKAVA